MEAHVEAVTELPALLNALTSAVSTLAAVGADGACDVRLYASGCSGGRRTSDLRLEGERLSLKPVGHLSGGGDPPEAGPAERVSIMLAELCMVGVAWGWELDELAHAAGCTEAALAHWLGCAGRDEEVRLPSSVEHAIRRILVIEHQRHLLGIEDEDAETWVLTPMAALDGLSIAILLSAGARHFHLVQRMLCDGSEPTGLRAETLH